MAGPKKPFQPDDVLLRARRRLGLEILPGNADRPGLLALTRLLYPELDISRPDYVAWQYDQNPAGTAQERIGKINGQVVGQYTVIPLRLQVAGAAVKGSLSANTMTHPDYRSKGVFMLLAEEVFKACETGGISLTFGFPNPNSHKGFIKHLNFLDAGQLPLWLLPLDIRRLAESDKFRSIPGASLFLRAAAPIWKAAVSQLIQPVSGASIRPITSFDASFDAFWKKVRSGYSNLVVRDSVYLNWRFAKHPTRHYDIFAASSGGEVQGYIVTRQTSVAGISCGMLVDLLVPSTLEGERTARELIHHATRFLFDQGAGLAGCLAPQPSPLGRALRRSRYFICPQRFLPQPFPVILRWNGPGTPPAAFQDFKAWYLTMGDYDAV